jgi:glycopeptide antibiotics resistance protein
MTETKNRKSFPQRMHLVVLAFAYACFCLYGSLVPFDFRALAMSEAWERFASLPYLSISMERRADWVANLLVFIPLSFLLCAASVVDSSRKACALPTCFLIWGVCSAYSCAIEFSQVWFPTRTMSQNDIYAETFGSAVGCAIWLLVGQKLVDRLRQTSIASTSTTRFETILEFYTFGLLAYQLLPLDLTLSLAEIWRKLESGKIVLMPFGDFDLTPSGIYSVLRDVAIWIPVGALLTIWRCQPPSIRHWSIASGLGLGFVLLIEVLQVFVVSRFTSTSDVILGFAGILIGRTLTLRAKHRDATDCASPRVPVTLIFRVGLFLVYAAILCGVFWLPFNFTGDKEFIRVAYDGLWVAPFAKLYRGSEFNAISQILAKSIFFLPIGVIVPWTLNSRHWLMIPCATAAASLVGLGIELGQVMLPGKFADFTDILFYTSGALVGVFLWLKLLARKL